MMDQCDSNKQRRSYNQKAGELYNLPNACMSFSTERKRMTFFRWKKIKRFQQRGFKRFLTHPLSERLYNQCIPPRSKNQIVRSFTDSCMIISDLRLISYMIIQDHTENRTQNRHLRNLTSIVRCHASRTDYFSTVFPFSNEYIISCTKISVNNWKFYFVFTLSSHIQPTLITYEFC